MIKPGSVHHSALCQKYVINTQNIFKNTILQRIPSTQNNDNVFFTKIQLERYCSWLPDSIGGSRAATNLEQQTEQIATFALGLRN